MSYRQLMPLRDYVSAQLTLRMIKETGLKTTYSGNRTYMAVSGRYGIMTDEFVTRYI